MRSIKLITLICLTAFLLPACGGAAGELPGGFGLSVSPPEITVAQEGSNVVTVSVSRIGSFRDAVAVSLVGPPAGVSAAGIEIPEGQRSRELVIVADSAAEQGSSTVTVRGTSGALVEDAPLTVTVVGEEGGFSLLLSPADVTVARGGEAEVTVGVNRTGDFDEAVTVTLVGEPQSIPAGVSAAPLIIAAGETSGVLVIAADASAEDANGRVVTVRGTGSDLTADAELALTVAEDEVEDDDAIYPMHGLVILTEFTLADGYTEVVGDGLFGWAAGEGLREDFDPFADFTGRCFVNSEVGYPFESPEEAELSAGERLTVYAGGSPYASLIPQPEGLDLSYFTEEPPAAPLPDGLSIDVPGEDFPGFADRPFPGSAALALALPQDPATIDLDTTFSWNAFSDEAVVVFSGLGDGADQSFTCVAPDTGSFAFPAETRAQLEALGFTGGSLSWAGRFSYQNHADESGLLTLVVARVLDFERDDDWEDWEDWED
jgi:hypothetical protein